MKITPIAEIIRRIRPLDRENKISTLRGHIASEQGCRNGKPNIYKTSVRIRELQAALKEIVSQELGFEVRQEKKQGRAA